MTRGQYLAMCLIGAVAVVAYLQSYRLAAALTGAGVIRKPQSWTA